jgi:DNA-binding CsgD family transcriptional regulator/PAS domain-containing protein
MLRMTAIAPSALSKLIANIYDCALDPALWPQTLEKIAQHFHAVTVSIFAIEPMAQIIVFAHTWGDDPARIAADAEKTNSINPFLTIGWHNQVDEPARLRSFMDPQELLQTRFYKEFMVSKGWFDFANATLQKSATRYTAISAPRPKELGEVSDSELEIMGLLAPHVRRALTIHETLEFRDCRLSGLRAALDLSPSPIFLLDDRGDLQEVNRAAERFLAEEGAARIERGRLYFNDARVHQKFAAALAAAGKGEFCPAETAAIRTAGGRAFAMEMLPLTSPIRQMAAEPGRAVLALFIQEVGALQPLPGEVLVKLYGLTPAETRILVFLAQGMSLPEAAATLGVGEATVKTHMHNVFAKTGTNRQAEVVKLVMSALPQRRDAARLE